MGSGNYQPIEFVFEPGVVRTRQEFTRLQQAAGVAAAFGLDGAVDAPPFDKLVQADDGQPTIISNRDHHLGVPRAKTPTTCEQTLTDICNPRGVLHAAQRLSRETGRPVRAVANAADEDIDVTRWDMDNAEEISRRATIPGDRWFSNVVQVNQVEGAIDRNGGFAPPGVSMDYLSKFYWSLDPYRKWRQTRGALPTDQHTAAEYDAVTLETGERITALVEGRAGTVDLSDNEYEPLGEEGGWLAVREIGKYARLKLGAEGHRRLISMRDCGDGTNQITVMTDDPRDDLRPLYKYYNHLDGVKPDDSDRWGSSPNIGGPPRIRGTTQDHVSLLTHAARLVPLQRSL